MKPESEWVVVFTKEGMGHGDVELQLKLAEIYLKLILENKDIPKAICFYTEGVKLAVMGSPVLDLLHQLEERGVRLILCSTCLAHYDLIDHIAVGIAGGMGDIMAAQAKGSKGISI